MKYIPLSKVYYQNISDSQKYLDEYTARFNASYTRHFPVSIRQMNRKISYPVFYCYTEEMILLIQHIYEQFQRIQYLSQNIPETLMTQYAFSCLIDEVQATNDIEGVRSTKKQIQNALEDKPLPKNFRHLSSVIDKYKKILDKERLSFASCQDVRDFYDGFVLQEVLQEHPDYMPDGAIFRAGPVEITSKTNRPKHIGVLPESEIISCMDIALQILHDPKIPFLPRLSAFHYLFEYIHPFYDGNGRTGRFIISYYLSREFNAAMASRLSIAINRNKNKYYKMFEETNSEFNRGDLTPFITLFLSLIDQAANDSLTILSRKKDQLVIFKKELEDLFPNADTLTKDIYYILLQASAFYGLGVTMEDLMRLTGKTRATLKSRFAKISSSNLIINKDFRPYHYKLNLSIFRS